eukprot:scaffold312705_cov36-Prasinocladus_malaysianus.AAC.1
MHTQEVKPAPLEPEEFDALKVGEDIRAEYEQYWPLKRSERRAGIIMHPTSLPGAYGTGEIGKQAMAFVDWVASAGLTMWQVCYQSNASNCLSMSEWMDGWVDACMNYVRADGCLNQFTSLGRRKEGRKEGRDA